jgi:hypothetical protein
MYYLLDENKEPYPATLDQYMMLFDNIDMKQTAYDEIDGVRISTVFLVMDHGWRNEPNHVPVLWETMIFNGEHDYYQERYTSHQDALEGHKKALGLVMEDKILTLLADEGDIPPGYIDDYIKDIKSRNIFDKYADMLNEQIISDWSNWMDNTWQFKDTRQIVTV